MNESFKYGSTDSVWVAGDDTLTLYNNDSGRTTRWNYDDFIGVTYEYPYSSHSKEGQITLTLKKTGRNIHMIFSKQDRYRAKQVYYYIKEYIATSGKNKEGISSGSADGGKVDHQEVKDKVANLLQKDEKKKTIRNICIAVLVIAFVLYGIWGIFFNSASSSSSDSWKNDANKAGYYEENGKWNYQGGGVND